MLAAPSQLIRRCFPEDVWSDAYICGLVTPGLGFWAHFFASRWLARLDWPQHAAMVLIALLFDVIASFAIAELAAIIASSRILMYAQGAAPPRLLLAMMSVPLIVASGDVILNL